MPPKKKKRRVIILGAAGRDFHNFNIFFRDNPNYEVVAFTAAQIPHIEGRRYPPKLAGKNYPKGIPIYPEKDLEEIIKRKNVDVAFFSYSDVSFRYVMKIASRVLASGASFSLLGPKDTMLKPRKPVISICATRTGAGKSPLSRWVSSFLREKGVRVSVVRHPMPYGDLEKQEVQEFDSLDSLKKQRCTIEEIEEYQPHIENGFRVFAGVDYKKILELAQKRGDIILWDGGNNDLPFYHPNLHIVVADALRSEDSVDYHPGNVNLRMTDVVVISKFSENPEGGKFISTYLNRINPKALVVKGDIVPVLPEYVSLKGKKVIAVEDGPSITHGGLPYGIAYKTAKERGASLIEIKDYAVGEIKEAYEKYPHISSHVLPALGYSESQLKELETTINKADGDLVLLGTPADIGRLLHLNKPVVRVKYNFTFLGKGEAMLKKKIAAVL